MPTYTNVSTTTKNLEGVPLQPEQAGTIKKYLYPPNPNFELTSHGPAPWVTLHAAAAPVTLTGLSKYKSIQIKNASGAAITCVVNEDSSNPLAVLSGEIDKISQDREIEKLEITGSGGSPVYVYGWLGN
ncbi:MAG: hypothetical protein HY913_04465 [Desulfomonile tiedjei]|nr:hypothetical protein [Desulfomonile tiedjei]